MVFITFERFQPDHYLIEVILLEKLLLVLDNRCWLKDLNIITCESLSFKMLRVLLALMLHFCFWLQTDGGCTFDRITTKPNSALANDDRLLGFFFLFFKFRIGL